MGKKYDAYAQAAQAEQQAQTRYQAEQIGGDQQSIQQAATDLNQTHAIANALWDEVMEDPQG